MKIAKVLSAQNDCLDGHIIQVEVDISRGLHAFSVVGMANKSVAEAKDRIASAIKHSGYTSPKSRNEKVVISLAPAHLPKEGTGFDLAMAIGYLIATKDLRPDRAFYALAEKILFIGELALDGNLRSTSGVLAIAKIAAERGIVQLFVPKENADEACLIPNISIYGATTLKEVIQHLEGVRQLSVFKSPPTLREIPRQATQSASHSTPFHEIVNQEAAKRALCIALAGRHTVALIGPPGTGKTLLAKSSVSVLPDLRTPEQIEVATIHSSANILGDRSRVTSPPFRAPHHSASYAAIIGGGGKQPVGEITLAHRGILFLDEFPEFDRRVIEALRQPMEEKVVRISRAEQRYELPADCIIILAMNPCPCGYRGSLKRACTCSQPALRRYAEKISGPIIDRIDIWVRVEQNEYTFTPNTAHTKNVSAEILKNRIASIHAKHQKSNDAQKNESSHLGATEDAIKMLKTEAATLAMSTRGFHRTLRVARTIADFEDSENIEKRHILESLQYRKVTL